MSLVALIPGPGSGRRRWPWPRAWEFIGADNPRLLQTIAAAMRQVPPGGTGEVTGATAVGTTGADEHAPAPGPAGAGTGEVPESAPR